MFRPTNIYKTLLISASWIIDQRYALPNKEDEIGTPRVVAVPIWQSEVNIIIRVHLKKRHPSLYQSRKQMKAY